MVIEKIQSIKVKKTTNNTKKTLTKIIYKKGKLNEIPNIDMATQRNESYI